MRRTVRKIFCPVCERMVPFVYKPNHDKKHRRVSEDVVCGICRLVVTIMEYSELSDADKETMDGKVASAGEDQGA